MSKIQKLVEEVGAVDIHPPDTTMTLDQAKRLAEIAERQVSSTSFASDDEFFEILDRVTDDWPTVELRFAGKIDSYGYIDTALLCYDWSETTDYGAISTSKFKEYCVVHFKHWMTGGPEDNEGVCPTCDDRISFSHERFRDDDNLLAAPDEFDFYEYPNIGKCVRLWWDD